jgi:hypothetical protein
MIWSFHRCSYDEFYLLGYNTESRACYLLHAGFLLYLFFNTKDEGDVFLWNFGRLSTDFICQKIEPFNFMIDGTEYIYKKFWEELIAYFPLYETGYIENDLSKILLLLLVYSLPP